METQNKQACRTESRLQAKCRTYEKTDENGKKHKVNVLIVGTKGDGAIQADKTRRKRLEMGCGCLFWLILAAAACALLMIVI